VQSSVALVYFTALPALACWDDAAQRYQVSSALLYAIARTESGLNPQAINRDTNIQVGAWILAGNIRRLGYTWNAVGAYNATRPALRRAYIEKVRRHLPATLPGSAPSARGMTFASLR
jgi:soluble lytic murein transglycosylase-like protein